MKSLYESLEKTLKNSARKDAYSHALQLVIHESDSLWQISNVFIVANSLIAALISDNLFKPSNTSEGIFIISLIGLLITIVWFFSIERARKYHLFRIAQAKQREPESWLLLTGDVEYFAEGVTIEMKNKQYNRGFGIFSNISLVRFVVFIFILFYMYILYEKAPFTIKPNIDKDIRCNQTYRL